MEYYTRWVKRIDILKLDVMSIKRVFNSRILLVILFSLAFFASRLPSLGSDEINPDGVNWHYRSEQFIVGLKTGQLEKTYQHYHPGVTLMWIMGSAVEILKQISPGGLIYTHYHFLAFHTVAKYALVVVQLVLSAISIYLLSSVWVKDGIKGFYRALLVVSLFSFEPFFTGNSRLLHLDVLFTLLLFNGLILAYLNTQKFGWVKGSMAGIFLGLTFLTKSIGIGGIMFALLIGGFFVYRNNRDTKAAKALLRYILCLLASFIATVFIFFPALWIDPLNVIIDIFSEGERIGIRNGHGQIILGEYTRNAGPLFYPLVLLLKMSPVIWIGLITFLVSIKSEFKGLVKNRGLMMFLALFYLGYFLVMTYPSKKIDRYMIPVFPLAALFAVTGFERIKGRFKHILVLSASAYLVFANMKYHPYQFTYTSPIFGSPESANRLIAEKPFGIGIPLLKTFILENYGYYPDIGFIDTKPMRSIYMNSRIFDIRVNGTSDYDLLILGVNEELPEKVINSKVMFIKDSSIYINGLEYWRIYVKEGR